MLNLGQHSYKFQPLRTNTLLRKQRLQGNPCHLMLKRLRFQYQPGTRHCHQYLRPGSDDLRLPAGDGHATSLNQIRVLTNHPKKIVGLEGFGLNITEQIPIDLKPSPAEPRTT